MSSAGLFPEIAGTTNEFDVLCGQDDFCSKTPGNLQFRTWVNLFKDQYVMGSKAIQAQLCARIVGMVQVSGGRFLIVDENDNTWVEASYKRALKKTSQALRDTGPDHAAFAFDDKSSLKPFRKRFYKFWDSKAVRRRAQFLLQCRRSTRNVILATDVASHRYVPTSDAFLQPPSPPEEDQERSVEASISDERSSTKKRTRLSHHQELSDEENYPRSKSLKMSSGKDDRKSLSSSKKSKTEKHKKISAIQKSQENYINHTRNGQPMRVADLDPEDTFSDESDDNNREDGMDSNIRPRTQRTHRITSKKENRQDIIHDFNNLNLPDSAPSEEDVPMYGELSTEVASPPKDGDDNVHTNVRKSASTRPQKNDNDDEETSKKENLVETIDLSVKYAALTDRIVTRKRGLAAADGECTEAPATKVSSKSIAASTFDENVQEGQDMSAAGSQQSNLKTLQTEVVLETAAAPSKKRRKRTKNPFAGDPYAVALRATLNITNNEFLRLFPVEQLNVMTGQVMKTFPSGFVALLSTIPIDDDISPYSIQQFYGALLGRRYRNGRSQGHRFRAFFWRMCGSDASQTLPEAGLLNTVAPSEKRKKYVKNPLVGDPYAVGVKATQNITMNEFLRRFPVEQLDIKTGQVMKTFPSGFVALLSTKPENHDVSSTNIKRFYSAISGRLYRNGRSQGHRFRAFFLAHVRI